MEKPDACDNCKKVVNQLFYYKNNFLCSECFHSKYTNPVAKDVIIFDNHINLGWIICKYIPKHFEKGVQYG